MAMSFREWVEFLDDMQNEIIKTLPKWDKKDRQEIQRRITDIAGLLDPPQAQQHAAQKTKKGEDALFGFSGSEVMRSLGYYGWNWRRVMELFTLIGEEVSESSCRAMVGAGRRYKESNGKDNRLCHGTPPDECLTKSQVMKFASLLEEAEESSSSEDEESRPFRILKPA